MGWNGTPDRTEISERLQDARSALEQAAPSLRPPDARGRPGGLVYLPPTHYVVIVPDLHARADFLRAVMATRLPIGYGSVEEDLAAGGASVVCVGDAFHAEARARDRWKRAFREFVHEFRRSPAMDEEMAESFDTLCEIARLQISYPWAFHFLKGNHENIANERQEGNFPFRKYAYEGAMVREWVLRKLGEEIFDLVYRWEKALPLAAAGDRFLVTHAEPARALSKREIVDAYLADGVIQGLTWTDNGQADPGSVAGTLESFFPGAPVSLLFGGHRPVAERYSLRQEGRYVQINTPERWVVAAFRSVDAFEAEEQIVDLAGVKEAVNGADS